MTKENVLKMLEKYTPQTRLALLYAAKECKEIREQQASNLEKHRNYANALRTDSDGESLS